MPSRSKQARFAEVIDAAERQILDALPEVIEGLVKRAREGDVRAASCLLDRIVGRAAGAKYPPAEDHRRPDRDFFDLECLLGRSGAGDGV